MYQNQYWWVVVALIIAHILFVGESLTEFAVVLLTALAGIITDSLLALFGVYIFSGSGQFLPIPFWLILLWFAFASTLRHSLAYLSKHYRLAAGLGAVGGTLSYVAGMKLQAVTFGLAFYPTVLLLACIWACLMPVIFLLCQRVEAVAQRVNGSDTFQTTKEKL